MVPDGMPGGVGGRENYSILPPTRFLRKEKAKDKKRIQDSKKALHTQSFKSR